MITKEIAEQELSKTIQDFKENYDKYKSISEADVETKLIEELFIKVLGWEKSDFVKQEKVHRGDKRGRADYAFKIHDKIVFFLEVKKIGVPLEKEADKQVISYALSQRVPFAISTNFEQMKIFCVEQENAINNVFRVFKKPEEYLNNLSDLLFLSKESFQSNLLIKKASDEGRLKKRNSIDKILLEDLMHIRRLIATDIEKRYPQKYSINELDEIVQRILDRLIFIRRCEDIGIQPDDLRLFDITALSGDKAYSKLKDLFKKYDGVYNSGLFALGLDNDCDKITIDGEIIKNLIHHLYESKDKEYIYNFDWIDADVLGQVYEQYLGKILQQTKSGKAKLKDGQAHRKEQGIYYTPIYIVDYIVKNVIGELMKGKKVNFSKIKILDPACGSGSFLIKAFDYLNECFKGSDEAKQNRIDHQGSYSIKTEILKNNIYGIDLDNKAVEITKLNLLLKAAEKNRKLPEEVDLHIRHANSLIDDETTASLNAFKWQGDFQEGTFDIIIGNPPWGADIVKEDKEYYLKNYKSVKREIETHLLFLERSIKILKEGGYLGFILPNTWLYLYSAEPIRKIILDNCEIKKIIELSKGIFDDAQAIVPIIIILKKQGNKKIRESNKTNVLSFSKQDKLNEDDLLHIKTNQLSQIQFAESDAQCFNIALTPEKFHLINKIKKEGIELSKTYNVRYGIKTGDNKKFLSTTKQGSEWVPCLKSKEISRYGLNWKNLYLKYVKELAGFSNEPISIPKIVIQYIRNLLLKDRLICALDSEGEYYPLNNYSYIEGSSLTQLKFLMGLLNSKLMNFYFSSVFIDYNIKPTYISKLPIKDGSLKQQIITYVDKMILLNKKLIEFKNKQTSERLKIEEEIAKTNKEIDELVYTLYNISKEEKIIIEEGLN